jgi:hypothetical protein
MNKQLVHPLGFILLVATILPLRSHASESFVETQTVTFKEFHDLGYLVVESTIGESLELWFHYELIFY